MAFDAFLKIDGITDNLPGGEIQLESYSWGVSNPNTIRSGGGPANASFQDFSFASVAGQQSPKLLEAALTGRIIPSATLRVTVTVRTEPLAIRFMEVLISGYKMDESELLANSTAGTLPAVQLGAPMENVTLNFLKMEFSVGGGGGFSIG